MSLKIVLILGAGPRVGAAVAEKFAGNGYKVALASRKGSNSKTEKGYLSVKADFVQPDTVSSVFDAVKTEFGASPSVVVYNAASLTPPPDPKSALSITSETFKSDLSINTISAYVAAQNAVAGWETLPAETKKSFIFTGNGLNTTVLPGAFMLNLGVGKSASAYWLGVADLNYADRGYRFFYADERSESGGMKGLELDGEAHGDFYAQLATHEKEVPWHATFVKGKGYVKF
ncbi:unnamed protein product [Clonostachys rosea]|uniref:Uncharacterized protein n=1 Tax=Bionectria ochroleuca TaxID=29856 RepID=A0ABY6U352_BIOOC|nr:unnamed protein product [Clonostachys rosea]